MSTLCSVSGTTLPQLCTLWPNKVVLDGKIFVATVPCVFGSTPQTICFIKYHTQIDKYLTKLTMLIFLTKTTSGCDLTLLYRFLCQCHLIKIHLWSNDISMHLKDASSMAVLTSLMDINPWLEGSDQCLNPKQMLVQFVQRNLGLGDNLNPEFSSFYLLSMIILQKGYL